MGQIGRIDSKEQLSIIRILLSPMVNFSKIILTFPTSFFLEVTRLHRLYGYKVVYNQPARDSMLANCLKTE